MYVVLKIKSVECLNNSKGASGIEVLIILDLCVPRSLSLLSLSLSHTHAFSIIFPIEGFWIFRENARLLLHDTVRFDASWWWTVCVHIERERSFSRRRRRFRFASHHRRLHQSQCLWQTKELLLRSRSWDRYLLFPYLSLLLRSVVVLVWRCLASSRVIVDLFSILDPRRVLC